MKDLKYYKNNCEEDYLHTPISVLRYITELEKITETKPLIIDGVSHQRELLIDAISNMTRGDFELRSTSDYVDEYLESINCG